MDRFLSSAQKGRNKIWSDSLDDERCQQITLDYQLRFKEFLVKDLDQTEVHRHQKRRVKHQEKIWHFMSEPERPCHNNQSEGTIRMFK